MHKKMDLKRLPIITLVGAALALALSACGGGGPGPQASPTPASNDVVHSSDGVQLGSGWYPVEHYQGLMYRWATNDAEITACPNANNHTLAMLLEPGPGVGSNSFTLQVRGNHGDRTTATVTKLQYVKVTMPDSVSAETFVLHAQSNNLPTPHDKRILNFRALDILLGSAAADCKNGVVRDGSPLKLEKGWYPLETFAGLTFRWVNNNAQLKLTAAQPRPFAIEADVEPGPSLGGAPLSISVLDSHGKTIGQSGQMVNGKFILRAVKGRAYVEFHLPPQQIGSVLTLAVQSKGIRVRADSRILNYRVFDMKIKP